MVSVFILFKAFEYVFAISLSFHLDFTAVNRLFNYDFNWFLLLVNNAQKFTLRKGHNCNFLLNEANIAIKIIDYLLLSNLFPRKVHIAFYTNVSKM